MWEIHTHFEGTEKRFTIVKFVFLVVVVFLNKCFRKGRPRAVGLVVEGTNGSCVGSLEFFQIETSGG